MILRLIESLMSSVFGLNVTPKIETFLFLILFFKILLILFRINFFLFSLDLTTDFTIDKSTFSFSPIEIRPLVSLGKQEPP